MEKRDTVWVIGPKSGPTIAAHKHIKQKHLMNHSKLKFTPSRGVARQRSFSSSEAFPIASMVFLCSFSSLANASKIFACDLPRPLRKLRDNFPSWLGRRGRGEGGGRGKRRKRSQKSQWEHYITSQSFWQLIEAVHKARCRSHRPRRNATFPCSALLITAFTFEWYCKRPVLLRSRASGPLSSAQEQFIGSDVACSFPQHDPTSYFFYRNLRRHNDG